jgi:hypothetical protein
VGMKSAVAGQNNEFLLTVTHELSGLLDSATKIASATSGIANSPSATFELSSTPVRSTFECGIDGGVFSLRTSPKGLHRPGGWLPYFPRTG